MAFEAVQIQSTRNGSGLVVGFREDLAVADVVTVSLTSYAGVSTVQWVLKGRPEGSTVGGAGPEPITLATAPQVSFTVDADAGVYHMDGTYVLEAVINPGAPGETRKTVLLARLSGLTITGPGGEILPLRKMGGFESTEDGEKPNIFQGYKTQQIRWLEWQRQTGGGGGGGGVASITAGPGISITGTLTNPIVNNTGVLSVTAGPGISVTGTAQNPIISNTGVIAITAGPGISVTGTSTNPIVTNTGVRSVTAGANIVLGGTATDPVISSTGGSGGGGIVQVIHAGPGISVTGTATDPIINNTGVLSVTAGTNITVTGTAQNPIINAAAAAGSLFDRANLAGMTAIDDSAFTASNAYVCKVNTVGDFYQYAPGAGLTPDGITILPSFAGLGQWHRMGITNPAWTTQLFWAVDEVSGSDENQGCGANQAAADLVPLRTVAELNRRLVGAVWTATVQIHQLSDLTACVPLTNPKTAAPNIRVVWLGVPVQLFPAGTGTTPVTSFVAQNPATNTGAQLQLSAIPSSWTASGLLDALVQSGDGTRTAIAQADIGSKTARLTTVCTASATTGNPGVPSTFTNGEGVRVLRPLALPCYPFGQQLCGCVAYCTISAPSINFLTPVGASSTIMLGKITGARLACVAGATVFFSVIQFTSPGNFLTGGSFGTTCVGVKNNTLAVNGGAIMSASHTPIDFENARVSLSEKAIFATFGVDSSVGIFNLGAGVGWISISGDALEGNSTLRMNPAATIYGANNTPEILSLTAGCIVTMCPAANITVLTAAPSPLIVAGVGHPWTDMPVADLRTGTFVNLG